MSRIRSPGAKQPISESRYLKPVATEINRLSKPDAKRDPNEETGTTDDAGSTNGSLIAEQLDTITVQPFTAGGTVTVAKPPHLRGAIATRPGNVNPQEIWPAYSPGSLIWFSATDNTGVTDVLVIDDNNDARTWVEPE